jgi:hypothetical protein
MHLRPTAEELIAAVREHLENAVLPLIDDPRVRFETLVAAHVLSIVERELARGEGPAREALLRLEALGIERPAGDSVSALWRQAEEELCLKIRGGEADSGPFRDRLLEHVRETLRERLRVASPDFPAV